MHRLLKVPIRILVSDASGEPLKNLFLNVAHGSRGITFSPFLAENLAAQICGEEMQLSDRLLWSLSAQRHWDRLKQAS